MTDEQITAIAREYAEETIKGTDFDDMPGSLRRSVLEMNAKTMEKKLKWLLRRFCLVEKNKVEEMYLNAKIAIVKGYDENLGGMMAVGSASKSILESLFPDLGKEVEG